MIESLLLVIALSLDSFATSTAYAASGIRIPLRAGLILAAVSSAVLGLSLSASLLIQQWISPMACTVLSFALLAAMGLGCLCQSYIKDRLRKRADNRKQMQFKISNIGFVLDIFLDETKADAGDSKTLSCKEAFALSIALSIDSLATGIGSGLAMDNHMLLVGLCFAFTLAAVLLGKCIGGKLARMLKHNLSYLSGALLLVLAGLRFF